MVLTKRSGTTMIVGATINDLPTTAGESSFVSEDNREKVVNSDIFPL